jgi:ankyrin repeat protein
MKNSKQINVCRILVILGIVLMPVSRASAQFGNLGNLINKELNKKTTTTPPPTDKSKATTDAAATNSTKPIGDSQTSPVSGDEASTLNLPPIFEAARQGDEIRFSELLKKDMSSINKTVEEASGRRFDSSNQKRNSSGKIIPDEGAKFKNYTLLIFAAAKGSTNIIQQLLDLEADVNANNTVLRPLSFAAGNGHIEAVKMLLNAKADPNDGVKAACENGHADVLKALLEAKGNGRFYTPSDFYEKLLTGAIAKGQLEIVQILLNSQTNKNNGDEYERRGVFRKAVAKGDIDIIKAFVAAREDLSDERDDLDRSTGKTLVQIAIAANQGDTVTYLKEAKKAQLVAVAAKEAAKTNADEEVLAARNKEKAAGDEVLKKKLLAFLDHPIDLFGMKNSRFRRFDGKVYDCAEPIEFLNRLTAFFFIEGQYNDHKGSFTDIAGRIEAESKWLHDNPWYGTQRDCSLSPVLVKQVTPDGLIVRLNSRQDEEILVFLKNHPKQKTAVDGEALLVAAADGNLGADNLFVVKMKPYQYTGVLGVIRTIPAYDLGVVVSVPSGSVAKLPLPE